MDDATPSPPSTPADDIIYSYSTVNNNNHTNNNSNNGGGGYFLNGNDGTNAVFYVNGSGGAPERLVRDWGADSIEDVNAATAMLALKHGPKAFADTFHHNGYDFYFSLILKHFFI